MGAGADFNTVGAKQRRRAGFLDGDLDGAGQRIVHTQKTGLQSAGIHNADAH
ncbi:hypothetical protein D3C76_1800830 [compost metagenome]